jgi:hypothetical protein
MQLLDDKEAARWCAARQLVVTHDWINRLAFQRGYPVGVRVRVPNTDRQSVAVAFVLLTAAAHGEEEFSGGLLWLQDWDVWSEVMERPGRTLLAALRSPDSRASDFKAAPAHLFEAAEFALAQATALLPILFQWDAWFVPATPECFYRISHEGYVEARFRTASGFQRELARFRELGWEHTSVEV